MLFYLVMFSLFDNVPLKNGQCFATIFVSWSYCDTEDIENCLFALFGSNGSSLPVNLIGLGIFAFILIIGYSFSINQREKYELRNKKIKIAKYKLELDCIEKLINDKKDVS